MANLNNSKPKLTYMHATDLTIKRLGHPPHFRYVNRTGAPVRDKAVLKRIKSLVLPPAWKEVAICASPHGHLQAVGSDARGRRQYRYHAEFRAERESHKYERLLAFGKILPQIRKRVARDLRRPGLPREKVLALITRLLETTLIRVGNEEYAKTNSSYGLTTMLDRHVEAVGSKLHFHFKGKSNVNHDIELKDKRLAKLVHKCQELPGQQLFQYLTEDGKVRDVSSTDVNQYIHQIAGEEFTAKDFRTWAGTVIAAEALKQFAKFDSQAQAKRYITRAIEAVAKRLGNTPTICRKCYIHPAVLDGFLDGKLVQLLKKKTENDLKKPLHGLHSEEAAVLVFLHESLSKKAARIGTKS